MRQDSGVGRALSFIRCVVGGVTYCLRMSGVRGIRRVDELTLEEAGDAIGWLGSEQGPIWVFRLAALLQQPVGAEGPTGKLLVLNSPIGLWAVLVDRVESGFEAPMEALLPLPTMIGRPASSWFEGLVRCEDQLLLALSAETLHPEAVTESVQGLDTGLYPEPGVSIASLSGALDGLGKVVFFSAPHDDDMMFGLSLAQVPQIMQALPVMMVPGSPAYVLGIMEWRETPLAVIDLVACMGGESSSETVSERLLIVRAPSHGHCVGIPVPSQIVIQTLPIMHTLNDEPLPLYNSMIRGQFVVGDKILVIPDIDSILSTYCESDATICI